MRIESFLEQSPVFQVSRVARRMEAAMNGLLAAEGVNLLEALVLAALFFEKRGAVKPSYLAETFQTTRGNVSHCVSSLEAKGLVKRQIDAEDARGVQLVLQPLGRRRAVRVMGILDRTQREFEQRLGVGEVTGMLEQLAAVTAVCEGWVTRG